MLTPESAAKLLYGHRTYHWEYLVLDHNRATGIDTVVGELAGVQDDLSINLTLHIPVKGRLDLTVRDVATAPGKIRLKDFNPIRQRIMPNYVVDDTDLKWSFGVYVVINPSHEWISTGHLVKLTMMDITQRLADDQFDETFVADQSRTILQWVKYVFESAGETIIVDNSNKTTLAAPKVWADPDVNKLTIANDLLEIAGFDHVSCPPDGRIVATPSVKPAARNPMYSTLPLRRELISGSNSIHSPNWTRKIDMRVPNKIKCMSAGPPDAEVLHGVATNENPNSPYAYYPPSKNCRDYWHVVSLEDQDLPDVPRAQKIEILNDRCRTSLIARTARQAATDLRSLIMPMWIGEVCGFGSRRANIDELGVITKLHIGHSQMDVGLMEVIDI